MIDAGKFRAWWQRLEERFGETVGIDAYLAYLNRQGLSTDEFEASAAAVWATSRFFPRPADFLLVSAGAGWQAVQKHAPDLCGGPNATREAYDAARAAIPDRAYRALATIGGPLAFRDASDRGRFRRDFLEAYELIVTEEALGSIVLSSGGKPLRLPSPTRAESPWSETIGALPDRRPPEGWQDGMDPREYIRSLKPPTPDPEAPNELVGGAA